MTLEERQLLLVDVSARLPYGVHVHFCNTNIDEKLTEISLGETIAQIRHNGKGNQGLILPYLRPMSSMTEEEREEYWKFVEHRKILYDNGSYDGARNILRLDIPNRLSDFTDWLNSHHFDYRSLIPMGFALEAPEDMYNKEQSEEESEIPIPKTVDEAVKTLAKIVSKEDRDYLLENGAISMHHSLGRWIRNEWGLWTDSELKNELKKKGFEHPDDMSNYIIEEFVKYCNNKL